MRKASTSNNGPSSKTSASDVNKVKKQASARKNVLAETSASQASPLVIKVNDSTRVVTRASSRGTPAKGTVSASSSSSSHGSNNKKGKKNVGKEADLESSYEDDISSSRDSSSPSSNSSESEVEPVVADKDKDKNNGKRNASNRTSSSASAAGKSKIHEVSGSPERALKEEENVAPSVNGNVNAKRKASQMDSGAADECEDRSKNKAAKIGSSDSPSSAAGRKDISAFEASASTERSLRKYFDRLLGESEVSPLTSDSHRDVSVDRVYYMETLFQCLRQFRALHRLRCLRSSCCYRRGHVCACSCRSERDCSSIPVNVARCVRRECEEDGEI